MMMTCDTTYQLPYPRLRRTWKSDREPSQLVHPPRPRDTTGNRVMCNIWGGSSYSGEPILQELCDYNLDPDYTTEHVAEKRIKVLTNKIRYEEEYIFRVRLLSS